MDGDCCMRQGIINSLGAEINELRSENAALKLEVEKLTAANTTSTKSICDGCLNKQCTMPERVCYKVVVSQCSGHK